MTKIEELEKELDELKRIEAIETLKKEWKGVKTGGNAKNGLEIIDNPETYIDCIRKKLDILEETINPFIVNADTRTQSTFNDRFDELRYSLDCVNVIFEK